MPRHYPIYFARPLAARQSAVYACRLGTLWLVKSNRFTRACARRWESQLCGISSQVISRDAWEGARLTRTFGLLMRSPCVCVWVIHSTMHAIDGRS